MPTRGGGRDHRAKRLKREEREARSASASALTAGEVAAALADLARLFADGEPATRHPIVQALFEQAEVLGPNEVRLYPSVEAEAADGRPR